MKVFTVFDSKAEAYLNPFYARTTAEGVRLFKAAADDPEHNYHRFAGDFSLFEIGEWDERTGDMVLYSAHENLGTALQHIWREEARRDEEEKDGVLYQRALTKESA